MKEIERLLTIKHLQTTPYHPACNGLVERFNGTLKTMLRRVCEEKPKQLNRFIPALLFAYRDSVQESTGFTPFQLLYGQQVRGPLTILRELWTKEIEDEEIKTVYQYVVDLRERLESTCKIVRNELEKNRDRYKVYADSKSKDRQFKVGDEVLLLLPSDLNKLIMQWKGPFKVVEKLNACDYRVKVRGKVKTYHGNMLKKYFRREAEEEETGECEAVSMSCISVIESEEEEEHSDIDYTAFLNQHSVSLRFPTVESKENIQGIQIIKDLNESQTNEVSALLQNFAEVFTDIPGKTDIVEHEIVLTSLQPVRSRPYPVPYALRKDIKAEIDTMLSLDIIEPCTSAYASPVVIVKKIRWH